MKLIKTLLSALIGILLVTSNGYGQGVKKVIGINNDATSRGFPSGICRGTLDLVNAGTVTSTAVATATSSLAVAPLENEFSSRAYAYAAQTVGGNLRMVVFDTGATPPVESSVTVVATGNSPYTSIGVAGTYYNSQQLFGTDGAASVLTRVAAPCNIIPCLARLTWNESTLTETQATANIGSTVTIARQDEISGNIFASYANSIGSFTTLRLTSGFSAGASFVSTNIVGGMTTDGTNLYITHVVSGVGSISTLDQVSMTGTTIAMPGGGTPTTILYVNGFLYTYVSSTLPRTIKKVRVSDMTVVATLNLTNTDSMLPSGLMYDTFNDKLYSVSNDSGTGQWRRINPGTLVQEDSLGIALATAMPNAASSPDFFHQRLYYVFSDTTNLVLGRISLCS